MLNRFIDRTIRGIPVRLRVVGSFLQIILFTGAVALFMLGSFNTVVTRLEQFTNVDAKVERLLLLTSRRVSVSQLNLNRFIQDYVPSPYEALDDVDQAILGLSDGLKLSITADTASNINLINQSLKDYQQQIIDLQRARASGDKDLSTRLESKLQKLGNDIGVRLELMVSSSVKQVTAANETVLRDGQASLRTALILLILALLLSGVLSLLTTLSITRPLANLRTGTEEFQQGNLFAEINTSGRDEITTISTIFNNLAKQIRELITNLEQRVADRTKALATSTEVSRRLSTILNEKELVTEVVGQVNTAFGYYHTQIYFYDKANEYLVMAGGTGEAGEKMLAQGHKIAKGRGLVGRAAESNKTVLVSDTTQNPEWLPNPLLPETKAEIAIPISIGDEVLGVLDVQQNIKDGLQHEDVDSLQSIANQVAIATQNTRQYRDSQQFKMGIERSGDAVFVTDPQGTITYANSTFEKVYGYTLSEVIGNTPRIIKSGLLTTENYQAFWGALLSKNSITGEIVNKHKDGHLVYIAGTNSPIVDDAGEIVGFLAVHHDITEQKRDQENTSQRAKQQEALNLITQKIQNTTSVEAALQVAARELGHALGMKSTLVTLDPEVLAGEHKAGS